MSAPLLLDTCAVIWAANGTDTGVRHRLREARESRAAVWISPITAWEIGTLAAAGRIGMARPVLSWFEEMLVKSGAKLAELGPRVLIASTELPEGIHRDPADRIIVATAREHGLRVVTRDRKILNYAEKGHVMAVAC
jgi:PIN domain nuclease of toxin-antitoxin system